MRYAQKYACKTCGFEKVLPEHPTEGKRTVNTGCPECGFIQAFRVVGRP